MKCIDKKFDEFLNGQFAPSQITPEMEQKLKDVVFNSDMVETTHGLLKYQDKLSMGNSKPGFLQGLEHSRQNNVFGPTGLFQHILPNVHWASTMMAMKDRKKRMRAMNE